MAAAGTGESGPSPAVGRAAALGARLDVGALALAGVDVLVAEDADAVRRAWSALPADLALVLLTPAAAAVLGDRVHERRVLTAVLP